MILDGKKLSEVIAERLAKRIKKMCRKPKLVIVQIGNREDSNIYIRNKKNFGQKIGAFVIHKKYPESVKEESVVKDIKKYNTNSSINGIIVQLPLSSNFNTGNVVDAIEPKKDVDGLTSKNTKLLFDGKEVFLGATTKGIITLLEYYKVKLSGKKVVIVGQSTLVGKPTMLALLNRGSTVTVCNQSTKNLKEETKRADILIVAVGVRNLITKNHVSKNQIIVDIGINAITDGKITGDVDYKNVQKMVKAITPVPGGVGPVTVASLFENLIQ